MLQKLDISFSINPIIEQVSQMHFTKRLALNSTTGTLFAGPYQTLPEFVGTPLGDVLESLGSVGEARLLKLESGEAYTAHSDPDDRIHLAIITHPHAYLQDLDNERMHHVPADGTAWLMDSGKTHVACNFGGKARIHLNIRVPLPAFTSPGYKFTFKGGDFDWKQELHISFMQYLNRAIKQGTVTGIEKVSDRELLLNATPEVVDYIKQSVTAKGFTVEIDPV
jgi:hypothetical protein